MSHLNLEQSLGFWPILNNFPNNQLSQIRSFMVINEEANPLDAVVITDDNNVFGLFRDASKVTKIVELGGGCGKKIVQMCHGKSHVLALTKEGQVLVWTDGLSKLLIEDENEVESSSRKKRKKKKKSLLPTVIDFGNDAESIAMIRCGLGHNLAVTKKTGKVYAWGNNELGQCGDGNQTNLVNPTKLVKLEDFVVVKVECGENHSMALTDNGLVYSWGQNQFGQLGIGHYNCQLSPVKVPITIGDDYPKDIACGSNHSLLLTEQGTVYGCGWNDYGQVGRGYNQPTYCSFGKVNINGVRFRSIYAVANCSIGILKSGLCYVWGQTKSTKYSSPYNTNLFSIGHSCLLGVHSPNTRISRLIQIASPISPLASTLGKSFNDSTSSDLKFVLDGRSIHVHRLLLQISSPYYQRMLSKDWLKSDSVEIDDYSYSVYYARLRYIYTGHYPEMDNLEEAIELFDLADYQLDYGLRDLCIAHLTEMVSIENCCRLFNLSIDYKLDTFRQTIGKFIAANLNNVMKSNSFKPLTDKQCRDVILSLGHFIKC